jgi:hypothetical protein
MNVTKKKDELLKYINDIIEKEGAFITIDNNSSYILINL